MAKLSKELLNLTGVKKIGLFTFLLLLLLGIGLLLMSWFKGGKIDQALNDLVLAHNQSDSVGLLTLTLSNAQLFSRDYQLIYAQKTEAGKKTPVIFQSDIQISHGPVQALFKSGDAIIELNFEINDLPTLLSSVIDKPAMNYLLNEGVTKQAPVKGHATFSFAFDEGFIGEFSTSNLSQVLISEQVKLDEILGQVTLDPSTLNQKIVVGMPTLSFLSNEILSADKHETGSVAQLITPQTYWALIKMPKVTFNLGNDHQIDSVVLTAESVNLDKIKTQSMTISFDTKNSAQSSLSDLNVNAIFEGVNFDSLEIGDISTDILIGNISFEILSKMIDTAHDRYETDKIDGRNQFNLTIYYFTQWLLNKEDFLANKPFIEMNKFTAKNDSVSFANQAKWVFKPNDAESQFYINPLITSLIDHTQSFSYALQVTQPTLKIWLTRTLASGNEKLADEYLFALNEMNKTLPFVKLVPQEPSNSKSTGLDKKQEEKLDVNLLMPNSVIHSNFSYDVGANEVIWLDRKLTINQFREYLNTLQ